MLKKLSREDIPLIFDVLNPRDIEEFKSTYLSGLQTWYAYGWFKENKLVGISTSHYNGDAPEWFLLRQYADHAEDLEDMIAAVCKEFESKNLYRFFWVDTDHDVDFLKNYIPSYYHHYKDYTVSPYGLPRNLRHFNILMRNVGYPTYTHFYMSVVPDSHRYN
jgi:hypothetical protein